MEMYRIVVADDEIEFRNWFRSLIGACRDFTLVGEAGSGEEALRLVHETNPDLVVADLYMPEPDGLEVIRILSQQSPNTRTILTSANCDPIHQQLAKDEGALAFIPKASFSLRYLRQALQEEW